MEGKLKKNSDQVGDNLREGNRSLTENLNGLKVEVSSLGSDLQRVKDSITQVRTQVESQLGQFQTEWDIRMEGRLNEVSSNVNSRINEVQEQVESLKDIARGTENQNSRRVNQIEKELENMQNRITVT